MASDLCLHCLLSQKWDARPISDEKPKYFTISYGSVLNKEINEQRKPSDEFVLQ